MAQEFVSNADASDMDYPEHDRTYHGFVAMAKWGTISIVCLLALMAIFVV